MSTKPISRKSYHQAVLFSLLSAMCLAIAAAFASNLTQYAPLPVIIFCRFLIPLLLVLGYSFCRGTIRFQTDCIKFHIIRSCFTVAAQYALFYVLTHSSILMATLLYSTSGLFSPIISRLWLKVKVPTKTIFSIVISFIGVSIALDIWQLHITLVTVVGLCSGLLTAFSQITQHYTSKYDSHTTSNIYMFGFGSLFSLLLLIPSMFHYHQLNEVINFNVLFLVFLLLFSLCSIGNQTYRMMAYKKVNKSSSLAPFLYMVIFFSGVIDWVFYNIKPEWNVLMGVCIIIFGGVIMSMRK